MNTEQRIALRGALITIALVVLAAIAFYLLAPPSWNMFVTSLMWLR